MHFDFQTATIATENFANSGQGLWVDPDGNAQLRCHTDHMKGYIEIAHPTLKRLLSEKCTGQKSIALVHTSRETIVVPLTELQGRRGIREFLGMLAPLQMI